MCKVFEDMYEEATKAEKKRTVLRMLADGTLTLEKIAEYVGLPVEEIRKLQAGQGA